LTQTKDDPAAAGWLFCCTIFTGEKYLMTDFSEMIKEWQNFYILVGTAAATLIGLLFVAVSIHIDIFHRKTSAVLRHFAALTFNCFFYVLLISILFLIPRLSPLGLGIPLLLLGALALVNAVMQKHRASNPPLNRADTNIASKFNLPIACLSGLVVLACGVILRFEQSLYGLIVVVFILLITGSQNAWALLVQTEDQDVTKTPEQ
jgi:uncharacterized membrane protein (DUF4010 family)